MKLYILSIQKTNRPVVGSVGGRVFSLRAAAEGGIYEFELPVTAVQFNGQEWELPSQADISLRAGGEISKLAIPLGDEEAEIGVPPFYHTELTVRMDGELPKPRRTRRGDPLFKIKTPIHIVSASSRLKAARITPIPAVPALNTETAAEAIKS